MVCRTFILSTRNEECWDYLTYYLFEMIPQSLTDCLLVHGEERLTVPVSYYTHSYEEVCSAGYVRMLFQVGIRLKDDSSRFDTLILFSNFHINVSWINSYFRIKFLWNTRFSRCFRREFRFFVNPTG